MLFAASLSVHGVKNDLTVHYSSQLEDPHYGVRFIYVYEKREREIEIEINSVGFWSKEETKDRAES